MVDTHPTESEIIGIFNYAVHRMEEESFSGGLKPWNRVSRLREIFNYMLSERFTPPVGCPDLD